ncbi:MAG: formylglycine-generating enzyme family protein [Actinopolymorphaceae bacterium]
MATTIALSVDWVSVPAGTLRRGTPAEDISAVFDRHRDLQVNVEWFRKEAPRSEVFVPAFRIARTAVTHAAWRPFTEATGGRALPTSEPDHPLTGLAWAEANAYCRWLSQRLGLDDLFQGG